MTATQWKAYWWARGIKPKPASVTVDQIDDMLDGANLAWMDSEVALGADCIRRVGYITDEFVARQSERHRDRANAGEVI